MTSARLRVRVQAAAHSDEFVGIRDGVLVVRVRAPAIEGWANQSLVRMLSRRLRLPRSSVTIVRGARSREKIVEFEGIDEQALHAAFGE